MLQRAIHRTPRWALATVFLAIVAAGLAALAVLGTAVLPARTGPPMEELAVTRTVLVPGTIELTVLNTGPDPVAVAQVFVNDAFADVSGGGEPIGRLRSATLLVDYPWQDGMPYRVGLLTSTGLVLEHEIAAAVATPARGPTSFARMALLGAMIGVVPVLLGMAALPLLRRTGPAAIRVLLAVTVGLLGFLAVDAAFDGAEAATATGGAFGGTALVVLGAALAFLVLAAIDSVPRRGATGWRLAVLIAVGIGLHNLGEGLAVGSAFALGELALGAALVVGFAVHNTTEGVAVVAPLAAHRVTGVQVAVLALVAGGPAMLGTVLGSAVTTPATAAFLLGVGVGAIARVAVQIIPLLRGTGGRLFEPRIVAGLGGGMLIMYLTGLLVAT